MYKIQLEVAGNKRWLTKLNYDYFCPVQISEDYYQKFLYKNFPFEIGDEFDLFPYHQHNIPSIKPDLLDQKLQKEAYQDITRSNSFFPSSFSSLSKSPKQTYYEKLTRMRYDAKLDHGIIPNLDSLYDRYIKPNDSNPRLLEFNKYGGIFNLELESSSDDDFWYEWMISNQMHNGQLTFADGDGDQTSKIEFWDCYCISIGEQMTSIGNSAMALQMRLSPAITRNRGVTHEKSWKITDIHQKYKPTASSTATEKKKLLVLKLEGPFTEDGKQVEELIMGNSYIYKATEYNDGEGDKLNNTHWSVELDNNGKQTNLTKTNAFEKEGAICYKYAPEKAEKIRIYAWCNEASKDVSVEVPVISLPFCVDRFRMPGLNNEGDDMAEDLAYGTGLNVTPRVYSNSDIEYFITNYIRGDEFGLTALSNRNNSYNKAIYAKDEIYQIGFDYNKMQLGKKVSVFLSEKIANALCWVDSLLLDVPDSVRAGSLVKYFNEHYTDEELFKGFEDLVTFYFAKGELEVNIVAMIHKFRRNEGGVYESDLLTNSIKNHESTNAYCEEIQDYIAEKLKNGKAKASGLIENEIDFATVKAYEKRRIKGKTTTRFNGGKEIFFLRPQFDSGSDLIQGQQVALNDIWATNIVITEFKIKGEEYTIKYDVTFWDHFGLDKPDLEKWFNIIGRARAIFAAWFTLQHLRGYKPFITKIHFSKEFKGKFSEGKYERVKHRASK